ncbi:putative murein peptide carboxypeptidase [subsurface metagenome]
MGTATIPKLLTKGDEIRIVAPASAVQKDYIDKSVVALSGLGYKTTVGKYVFSEDNQFAGTDEERLRDFQDAVNDQKVKAVFCARGGYGSSRIIDKIDFSDFRSNAKWIVGFSDITVFHSLMNCTYNIATIHSPMPVNSESSYFASNLKQLDEILRGKRNDIQIPYHPLNRKGQSRGKITGGNLSILHNLQSTPFEIKTENTVLFIEDMGEQLYHLDRMLNNLLLSGKFLKRPGRIM